MANVTIEIIVAGSSSSSGGGREINRHGGVITRREHCFCMRML